MIDIKVSPTSSAFRSMATAEKIVAFGGRPSGWHYGSGEPATSIRIRDALALLSLVSLYHPRKTSAFFGEEGQITVCGYFEDRCVELTSEADGTYTVSAEQPGVDDLFEMGLRVTDVAQRMFELIARAEIEECGVTSVSSNPNITIETNKRSTILHSPPQETVSQYFRNSVLWQSAMAPVVMLKSTIKALGESPQHFGRSLRQT